MLNILPSTFEFHQKLININLSFCKKKKAIKRYEGQLKPVKFQALIDAISAIKWVTGLKTAHLMLTMIQLTLKWNAAPEFLGLLLTVCISCFKSILPWFFHPHFGSIYFLPILWFNLQPEIHPQRNQSIYRRSRKNRKFPTTSFVAFARIYSRTP